MIGNPLISVIIPVYNREILIKETLDSILRQTYQHWECLIIDDGSTDNTIDIVRKYTDSDTRFHLYIRPEQQNKGPNSCRNYGFNLCKGDFIKWFDSDDIMYPNLLAEQILTVNYVSDITVCKLERVNLVNDQIINYNNIHSKNLISDYLVGKVAFYVCGPLWKKSFLLNQDELFDNNISNLDDYDFNLRMLYQKPKITFLNKSLIKYRIHNDSLSQEINNLNISEIYSEFNARLKHIHLLKKLAYNDELKVLKKFTITRAFYLIERTLLKKEYYLLITLYITTLKYSITFKDLRIIRVTIGIFIIIILNKGYSLLK